MWILECDGDILNGKRVWLRPGKTYLFGRTNPEKGRYAGFTISHKSVSRKHLTLSVSNVKPGDGSQVHTRSELALEDENTKIGTELDGERLKGGKKVLKGEEHEIRLGNYEHLFRIKWQPVVLSFTFPSKETKRGRDPLVPVRGRLEDLDIKAIIPYIVDKTTHVVASKRNTAKGLQALVNGKYIVDNSFMDALVYVTTPGNLDEPESLSLLEEDFDGNWPNALDHLPPPSKEPGSRSAEAFAPNLGRKEVFEGYTFIFCDLTQFETLQPPISNGGGKALYCAIDMGNTSAEDVIRYIKNVAGEKGLGEFEDGSEGKGVVVAKFGGTAGFEDWAIELQQQVALALDQRLIELNEFLDTILKNDASKLRRTLPEDTGESSSNAPINGSTSAHAAPVNEQTHSTKPEPSQPAARRARLRGAVVSQFRGFDDGFDPSAISTERKNLNGTQSDLKNGTSQHDSHSVSFAHSAMDVDSQDVNDDVSQARNTKKRSPPSDEEEDDNMNDNLLPAAAAMKRRRIEEENEARRRGISLETPSDKDSRNIEAQTKKRKPPKEINIQEVVRERREAEDEAARKEQDALRETLDGVDVQEMRNLAIIQEMEITPRNDRPQRRDANIDNNGRWNEQWNGRKNFKKFRRRDEVQPTRRGQSVMVPLEEVKKKDYGIGEEYWLESDKAKKKRKERERASHSQSQSQLYSSHAKTESEDVVRDSELITNGGDSEVIDVDVDAAVPSRLARSMMDQTQTLSSEQSTNTNPSVVTRNSNAKGKRVASSTISSATGPKKQKSLAMTMTRKPESDSEDELKFRFKRKR